LTAWAVSPISNPRSGVDPYDADLSKGALPPAEAAAQPPADGRAA
jgi:hypothetical protein